MKNRSYKKIINLCRKSNTWSKNKKGTNTKSGDELKCSERVDSWEIEVIWFGSQSILMVNFQVKVEVQYEVNL